MKDISSSMKTAINRRSFVKNGLTAAGVVATGAGLLADSSSALAQEGPEEHSGRLTKGDAALHRNNPWVERLVCSHLCLS
jgi:hypothetical protein